MEKYVVMCYILHIKALTSIDNLIKKVIISIQKLQKSPMELK